VLHKREWMAQQRFHAHIAQADRPRDAVVRGAVDTRAGERAVGVPGEEHGGRHRVDGKPAPDVHG